MKGMRYSAIDLFCGSGGLSLGLEGGFQILFAADKWLVATETYSLNFSHPVLTLDLAKMTAAELRTKAGIDGGPVHLVVGGPPCQGFSIQRIGADHDVRNNLVLEFGRLVAEFAPKLFLMENVPGLLGKRGRDLAAAFERQMMEAGYCVDSAIVNAAEYGVPQIRRRVFYYGWQQGEQPFRLPAPTHLENGFVTVWDSIGDLPPPPADLTPLPSDPLHRRTRLSALNQHRIELIPPGGGMEDLPVELRVECHKKGADRIGHRYVYGRLSPDKPSATITARFDSFTRGKFGHPKAPRNITLREGARLQTFPDSFRFKGTQEEVAAQIGNAVPPLLAGVLGATVHSWLLENEIPDRGESRFRGPLRQLRLFDTLGPET